MGWMVWVAWHVWSHVVERQLVLDLRIAWELNGLFQSCSDVIKLRSKGSVLLMDRTVCVCVLSHSWLWEPMDCSPPVSSNHAIFQARILEWVAISYSRGSSQPRDQILSLKSPALAGGFFTTVPSGKLPYLVGMSVFSTLSFPCWVMCTIVRYLLFSFWLTSLCVIGSGFIHLTRTDSNAFLFMAE